MANILEHSPGKLRTSSFNLLMTDKSHTTVKLSLFMSVTYAKDLYSNLISMYSKY